MSKTSNQKSKGLFSGFNAQFDVGACLLTSIARSNTLKRHRVLEALRAGILALIAKDTVAHGDFQKWWIEAHKEGAAGLSSEQVHNCTRSLRNYMRLASAFVRDAEGIKMKDFADAAFLIESVTDVNETGFAKRCRVFKAAEKWIDNRALSEIYDEEGIRKAEPAPGQPNPRKLSPSELQQQEFQQFCEGWQSVIGTVATQSKAGLLAKLPAPLRWEFAEATVPALEHIALHTTDFTPDQLKQLEQRLVTITGGIREILRTSKRTAA